MAKWKPCKRREFIKKLKKIGFAPPEPGGSYFYMRHGTYTFTLPSNDEYHPKVKKDLRKVDKSIKSKVRDFHIP